MAYEYDRFEREDGGGSFLMGLLAGTVLGAGLGMLFAPKPGTELRNQLGEQASTPARRRRMMPTRRRRRRSARWSIAAVRPTTARGPVSAAHRPATAVRSTRRHRGHGRQHGCRGHRLERRHELLDAGSPADG